MKAKLILIGILILGSVMRLYHLTNFPSGFNADEAALGYNAYSLMLTGKDEHGHPWPVNLESFGDFKPALYSYILIPFIKVLGLTEFATRLPSALMGIAAILFLYLFTKEVFSQKVALIAALILAISPWHLHFSRGAWEVNVASTLVVAGLWSMVVWLKRPALRYLLVWAVTWVLALYTYQSARVLVPVLGLLLAGAFFKALKSQGNHVVIAGVLAIIMLLPLGYSVLTSDAASRFSGVGLLADEGPLNRSRELRGHHHSWNSFLSRIFHNRPVVYALSFIENYTDHFDGNFLFVNGDVIERNRVPDVGLMYLVDAALICLGILVLLRSKNPYIKIVVIWLFVSPIASAMTFQTPHALRAQLMVMPLTVIAALGASQLLSKKVLLVAVVALYVFEFSRYVHQYYVHYPQKYPTAWEHGFKELVPYVEENRARYSQVYVTDKYDQPYILFLFYSKYSPSKFQTDHELTVRDRFNFSTVMGYANYKFENTPWTKLSDTHEILIVAAPEDIPEVGVNIVKTINFPNGQPAFKIVSN